MKPIRVDLKLTKKQLSIVEPLFEKVSESMADTIVMLQIYHGGDARGFWLPSDWARKANRLGKAIFKAAVE